MGVLDESGDLARTPLAALLLEGFNTRATGVLSVEHGGGTSRLFLRDGAPVGSQVFVGFRPLGHILLQQGRIDMDALSRSLAKLAETGRPQGEILLEMGAVSRADVERALAEQQAGYFAAIATLEKGRFRFDANAPPPEWTRGGLLSPLRTIVDAFERPQAAALVAAALEPVATGGIRLASNYGQAAGAFRWTPEERALVERLRSTSSLDVFLAPGGVPPERARAILSALLLLGLAGRSDDPITQTLELQISPEERDAEELRPAGAAPPSAPSATPPAAAPAPPRRSDPAEARARRQRLLHLAMQNMGIGPFAGRAERPGNGPAPAGTPARSATPPGSAEEELRRALLEVMPRAKEKNLFARLNITEVATRDQVKQAYLAIAKQFHPDRFAAGAFADLHDTVKDFFTAMNEAYEILADDRKRAEYARGLKGVFRENEEAARADFQKGEACFRTRDFARARGFFESALRAAPRPEYLAALAHVFVVDPVGRDRARARELLDEAMKDPKCDRAFHAAGVLARAEGDEGRAERMFRAALELNPGNPEAARELRLVQGRRAKNRD